MNILKITFIFCFLQTILNWSSAISLEKWKLDNRIEVQSMEKTIIEYFANKTRLLSIAIRLEYSHHWKFMIYDYLSNYFSETESITFEIFHNRYQKKNKFFDYNLWYVDSYKAFR